MVAEIRFCGTWDLQKRSIGIQLLYSFMKYDHLENFISFPLIYRFASIRCVLTELEADN